MVLVRSLKLPSLPSFIFYFTIIGFFSGCTHKKPNFIYMPDMVYSPAFKAQEGEMRLPVAGTVPRGFVPYAYSQDPEMAGKVLKNPLTPTAQVLGRGQVLFGTYCLVCHGLGGEGDGSIVPKFPRPPSLNSEKVTKWTDGRLYHVISVGQNLMPAYQSQVAPADRWTIVHYLRVLQKSQHPTEKDLERLKSRSKGSNAND